MFAIPFGRIFWKEYRVHRALWLSCLLIGCLFQFSIWYTTRNPQERTWSLLAAASFLPVMYAIGCGALLFASEREEKTCDWLVSLSVPIAPMLIAKLLFAAGATAAFQLSLAIFSWALWPEQRVEHPSEMLIPYSLLILIWSVLGSLLSRRVVTSALVMAFWLGVTLGFPLIIFFNRPDPFHRNALTTHHMISVYLVTACIAFSVFCVNVWLGWRWCQGKYIDGAVIENLNARYQEWRDSLIFTLTSTSVRTPRIEHEQQWQRTWQRLVWQERHREQMHLMLIAVACVLASMAAVVSYVVRDSVMFISFALIYPAPLAMGILAFASDTSLQQTRFLSNRGISPISFWLAKQVVWLPRAFWVTAVVFAFPLLMEFLFTPGAAVTRSGPPLLRHLWNSISAEPGLYVWGMMIGYGSGQLSSLLLRRTVLAIAFGATLNIASCFWLYGIEATQDSLSLGRWWSLGLPLLFMFLVTLWQTSPSLLEDHSWSRRGKLIASIVAFPVVLITFFVCHRVIEVTNPPAFGQGLVQRFSIATARQTEIAKLPALPQDTVGARLEVLSRADETEGQAAADEIVELMKRNLSSVAWNCEGWKNAMFVGKQEEILPIKLWKILLKQAEDNLRTGELDKAFEYQLTVLKLARATCDHSDVSLWVGAAQLQSWTMELFVNWANHPSQTPVSIREAIKQITAELMLYPSATDSIVRSFVHDRKTWVLSTRKEFVHRLSDYAGVPNEEPMFFWILLIPPERWRMDMLLSREAILKFVEISELETALRSPMSSVYQSRIQGYSSMEAVNQSLIRSTPMLHLSEFVRTDLKQAVLNRYTDIRATLTRMELIAFRLEHGQLPTRLVELMPSIDGINLVDPWSGKLFVYYPECLLSTGRHGLDLLPTSEGEFEFIQDDDRPTGKLNLRQALNVLSKSHELKPLLAATTKQSGIFASIFPIPLRMTSDRGPED